MKKSIQEFKAITGQKPLVTRSKKAIAGFKIREDLELGLTVTLRGEKMYAFLTKLIFFTFSQIRDFRGLSVRSFDKAGNYTLGLNEQLIFPEIPIKNSEIFIETSAISVKFQQHFEKSLGNFFYVVQTILIFYAFLYFLQTQQR